MVLLWKYFAFGFSALLPVVNPLGSALVFLGLVGVVPPEVYRSLARRIAIIPSSSSLSLNCWARRCSASSASLCPSCRFQEALCWPQWAGPC